MTAGFHYEQLKQYQILKRLERVDRDTIDMCLASCIIFVMNKASPQVTIGAPAPGEELAVVQMHRTSMVSQALGARRKDNAGTQRENLKLLWKLNSHKLTPPDKVRLSKCPRYTGVPNDHSSPASPCIHSQTLLSFSLS